MGQSSGSGQSGRFMPDWVIGGVIRLSLAPGLWLWGRAHAGVWPDVTPDVIQAAEAWSIPLLSAQAIAECLVWGSQLVAALLVFGFLTRIAGFALLLACAIFYWWIAPHAWPSIAIYSGMAFYLFARGAGALSLDGAISATTR